MPNTSTQDFPILRLHDWKLIMPTTCNVFATKTYKHPSYFDVERRVALYKNYVNWPGKITFYAITCIPTAPAASLAIDQIKMNGQLGFKTTSNNQYVGRLSTFHIRNGKIWEQHTNIVVDIYVNATLLFGTLARFMRPETRLEVRYFETK